MTIESSEIYNILVIANKMGKQFHKDLQLFLVMSIVYICDFACHLSKRATTQPDKRFLRQWCTSDGQTQL